MGERIKRMKAPKPPKEPRSRKQREDYEDRITEAELDAMIAERLATMPGNDEEPKDGRYTIYQPAIKVWRSDKRRKGFGTLV